VGGGVKYLTSKVATIAFKESFELESTLDNFSCLQISRSIWAAAPISSRESAVDAWETACNHNLVTSMPKVGNPFPWVVKSPIYIAGAVFSM